MLNFIGVGITMHNGYVEIMKEGRPSVETGADFVFGVVGFLGPLGTQAAARLYLVVLDLY